MADTQVADGLEVQLWDDGYFVEWLNADQFKPYRGFDANSIIHMNEQLTAKKGSTITFSLVNRLSGAGQEGNATLEGNEEALETRSHAVKIQQYRHAVRVPVLDEQFSSIPLRNAAKVALDDWMMELHRDQVIQAAMSIDGVNFSAASAGQRNTWLTNNADRVLFGNAKANAASNVHATALATIDNTADQLTPGAVKLMKRIAKTCSPKIRPLKPRQGGVTSDTFILFVPSLVLRDISENAVFVQANREARARGKLNPIFAGADYIYDKVAIIEVEDIPVLAGAGAGGIDVAPVFFMGAQALGEAMGKRPGSKEEEFDYGDKQGVAMRSWHMYEKLRFGTDPGPADTTTPKDHGMVTGWFAAVADS